MTLIQYPPVYIGLYALLLTAVSATASAASGAVSPANILFCAAFYAAGLFCGWKYNQEKPGYFRNLSNAVAVLALLLFVAALFSSPEKAFLVLLIGLQGARNFTLATRRDFYYSYVISLVLILYAASVGKNSWFILSIVIYVLSGVFTLMADHMDATLARARGGDRDVLIHRMNLPIKGVGLAAAVIALSVFFYFLVPRPPSPQLQAFPSGGGWTYKNSEWERQAGEDERRGQGGANRLAGIPRSASPDRDGPEQGGTADYGGFQKKFDIVNCRAGASDEIVFYLQSDRPLYVRAKTFDLFNGRTWTSSREGGRKIRDKGGFALDKNCRGYGTAQTFTIEADMTAQIPAAYRPVKAWFPASVIHQGEDASLKAPSYLRKGTVYSVLSDVGDREGRPCSMGEDGGNLQQYLQLPETLSGRVRQLGADVTQNLQDSYARAVEIERFLKTNYFYTLDTALSEPAEHVLDEFLFERKQGHCEYFASAMVVMLRSLNIPARLATGYAAYKENTITGYYEVRKKNAHAWVEAYIDGHGWMTFEPTSSFEIPKGSKGMFAAAGVLQYVQDRLSAALQKNPAAWWARAAEKVLALLKALWRMVQELLHLLTYAGKQLLAWLAEYGGRVLLAAVLLAGGAYGIIRIVVPIGEKIDRGQLRKKDTRLFIMHCYKEVEKALSRKKTPRLPFYAPAEYERIAASRFSQVAPSLEVITALFNRARYSSLPFGPEDADSAYAAYQYIMKFLKRPGRKTPVQKQTTSTME